MVGLVWGFAAAGGRGQMGNHRYSQNQEPKSPEADGLSFSGRDALVTVLFAFHSCGVLRFAVFRAPPKMSDGDFLLVFGRKHTYLESPCPLKHGHQAKEWGSRIGGDSRYPCQRSVLVPLSPKSVGFSQHRLTRNSRSSNVKKATLETIGTYV